MGYIKMIQMSKYLSLSILMLVPVILASEMVVQDFRFGSSASSSQVHKYDHSDLAFYNQDEEQFKSMHKFMIILDAMTGEVLNREDKLEYAKSLLSSIHTLVEEATNGSEESDSDDYDEEESNLTKPTIIFRKGKGPAPLSVAYHDDDYIFSKSKMVKDEEDNDDLVDDVVATIEEDIADVAVNEEEKIRSSSTSSSDSDDENHALLKRRGKGKRPTDNLAIAADLLNNEKINVSEELTNLFSTKSENVDMTSMPSSFRAASRVGSVDVGVRLGVAAREGSVDAGVTVDATARVGSHDVGLSFDTTATLGASIVDNSANVNSNINDEIMAKLQEQLMAKIMLQMGAQMGVQGPEAAMASQLIVQAAIGGDLSAIPTDKQSMLAFLRTSRLPFIINNTFKKSSGVDVLRTLSLGLKALDKSLGILENILTILIKTTKTVRYYILISAQIVADMSREDNMKPVIDLSVPMVKDSFSAKKQKKKNRLFGFIRFTKKGRRGLKSGGDGQEDEESPENTDILTLGMQLALAKARDMSAEFQKLPPTLFLKLIHTVLSEMESRSGVVRIAYMGKKHTTLMSLHDAIEDAIEQIYYAIIKYDSSSEEYLNALPKSVLTEILLQLVYPVKMEPITYDSHIRKVTEFILPIMRLLGEDMQLGILNLVLNEPLAEENSDRFEEDVGEARLK